MQQSVVQPTNSQRGMGAKGRRGDSEFWTRRPMNFYNCNKANKQLCHRLERRVIEKKQLAEWEKEMVSDLEADRKEMMAFFEDEYEDFVTFERMR